jgi:hypothetical protein
MSHEADDLVEIYAPYTAVEADRLVLLLAEDGVEALARATTISAFPTEGQHLLLVRSSERDRARQTIEAARHDGVVSAQGEWLDRGA